MKRWQNFFCFLWKRFFWASYRLRTWWWKGCFGGESAGLRVYGRISVMTPSNVFLEKSVTLNEGVFINARAPVYIGEGTHLSPGVCLNAGSLDLTRPERPHIAASVRIGKNVWLASGVIVNPGVTIHDGVVVGAGAVVTRDLPAYTLCMGVPAKPLRSLPLPSSL